MVVMYVMNLLCNFALLGYNISRIIVKHLIAKFLCNILNI